MRFVWNRYHYRKKRSTAKIVVYSSLTVLFICMVFGIWLLSGNLHADSFQKDIYDEELCMQRFAAFDPMKQPRMQVTDNDAVEALFPIQFTKGGLYGFIDRDGNVAVEPFMTAKEEFFAGYRKVRLANGTHMYYDVFNEPVPDDRLPEVKERWLEASKKYYVDDRMLGNGSSPSVSWSASPRMEQAINETYRLEFKWAMNIRYPLKYYVVHLRSIALGSIYAHYDGNYNLLHDQPFFNAVLFYRQGIAKADAGCSYVYLNADWEPIWYEAK